MTSASVNLADRYPPPLLLAASALGAAICSALVSTAMGVRSAIPLGLMNRMFLRSAVIAIPCTTTRRRPKPRDSVRSSCRGDHQCGAEGRDGGEAFWPGYRSLARELGTSRPRSVPGDSITGRVDVLEAREDEPVTKLRTTMTRDDGTVALEGTAVC